MPALVLATTPAHSLKVLRLPWPLSPTVLAPGSALPLEPEPVLAWGLQQLLVHRWAQT